MTSTITLRPGDIWNVELTLKQSDIIGYEQGNTRPCMVIGDYSHLNINIATIIPLTSQKNALRFPYTYLIKKDKNNGLKSESIALIFQLRSLSYIRFQDKIGYVTRDNLTQIKTLITNYLNL